MDAQMKQNSMAQKGISMRQIILTLLALTFSPTARFLATYASEDAKQAAWLLPFFTFPFLLFFFYVMQKTFQKHPDACYMDIISQVTGKVAGTAIVALYFIWLVLHNALCGRFFAEKLITTLYTGVDIRVFLIAMLVVVALAMHYGIIAIARMGELVLFGLVLNFCVYIFFMSGDINIKFLTPITYRDFIPVAKGSISQGSIWGNAVFLFFFSEKIYNKNKIMKTGFNGSLFLLLATATLIISIVGVLGYRLAAMSPHAFINAANQIEVGNVLEKIESLLITIWIASDFIALSVFSYVSLRMLVWILGIKDEKPFINIFLVLMFFLILLAGRNQVELNAFCRMGNAVNVLYGFAVPALILGIGKLRRVL